MSEFEEDPDVNKVVLIGDENVGKTSMYLRFKTGKFIETTTMTRYEAEHYKEWSVQGTPVKMTLFDTAGMERHCSTIPPTYFRHARAVILVYSIDREDSIDSMDAWVECFSFYRIGEAHNKMRVLLVGNKVDLEEADRKVPQSRAKEVAQAIGVPSDMVYEISTKTGDGFDDLFDSLALDISETPLERRKTIRAGSSNHDDLPVKKKSCPSANCSK